LVPRSIEPDGLEVCKFRLTRSIAGPRRWPSGSGSDFERLDADEGCSIRVVAGRTRLFSLGSGTADIWTSNAAGTLKDTVQTQFSASELLLSLRIYEPFRRWR